MTTEERVLITRVPSHGKGQLLPPAGQPGGVVAWQRGQSGNPRGRPKNGGATVKEWWNDWTESGITTDELRRLTKGNVPHMKQVAARLLLALKTAKLDSRAFREGLAMFLDYTDGRPTQHTQVEVKDPRSPAERCADLAEQLQRIGALPSPTPLAPMLDVSPVDQADWCDGAGI